jgi:lipopolysaccharide export system protein LptA
MKWRRQLRIGIAVFGIGFAIALYVIIRPPRGVQSGKATVPRVDPAAAAEGTRGDVRRLGVSGEHFRVEYDGFLAYPDGRQRLTGARVFVDRKGERSFKVTAKQADVTPNQDHVEMSGDVVLTASDGLEAKTQAATYGQAEGIVRSTGPTQFSRTRVKGASIGMTYDEKRDVLWMLDKAVVSMAGATPAEAPVEITAGAAGFARADHYVRYERGFRLVTGAKVLESDGATAYLSDDGARVETLDMRGRARITGIGDGAGAVRGMQADDINLEFAEDGRTMKGATLSSRAPGLAAIDMGTADAGGRRIVGRWVDVRLGADGATVTGLSVRDAVELALPATADAPARTIRSSTFSASGSAASALNSARFVDQVEFREAPKGAVPRVVRSRSLDLVTQPGLGAIDAANFLGAVRFEQDRTKGAAGEARYRVAKGVVLLVGIDDSTGQRPRVSDGQVAIDAREIEITLEGQRINARDDVRSVMVPTAQSAPGADGTAARRAGMFKDDQPVYGASAELAYDGTTRLAHYVSSPKAQARLWQGDTTIQGEQITVDDTKGNLTAKGKVASSFVLQQRNETTHALDRSATVTSADDLVYEDASRKATYTGNAHMAGAQGGDLRASRIEMFLKPEGNELDRLEGYTKVAMRDAARSSWGDRLTYTAADDRYVVVGAPAKVVADCREYTGRTLTFTRATNNIVVDPNDEARTMVKAIPNCVPAGRD